MTKNQIEELANNCGVSVSYTKSGKGGFIIDSSNKIHKSLSNIFKQMLCNHDKELEFVSNIYGDAINFYNGKRSIWKCCDCGKLIYMDMLWDNENLRFTK